MFKLLSNSIKEGEILLNKHVLNAFGCQGNNISPDLRWQGAPDEVKSYALICHDPDAPKENGWYHWLIVNIPKEKTSISAGENLSPTCLETITDFKTTGYGGACPPKGHGLHHYNFTIYALDIEKLDIKADMMPKNVEDLVKEHAISSDTITAVYER